MPTPTTKKATRKRMTKKKPAVVVAVNEAATAEDVPDSPVEETISPADVALMEESIAAAEAQKAGMLSPEEAADEAVPALYNKADTEQYLVGRNIVITENKAKGARRNALIWRRQSPWSAELGCINVVPGLFRYSGKGGLPKDMYLCYEVQDGEGYVLKTMIPLVSYNKKTITPQDCADTYDWRCEDDFGAEEDNMMDKIRLGVMITMVAVSFFALIIFAALAAGR